MNQIKKRFMEQMINYHFNGQTKQVSVGEAVKNLNKVASSIDYYLDTQRYHMQEYEMVRRQMAAVLAMEGVCPPRLMSSLCYSSLDSIVKDVAELQSEGLEEILQSWDDIIHAIDSDTESLNRNIKEYIGWMKLLTPYAEEKPHPKEVKQVVESVRTGILERDSGRNVHVGDCMVGYKYCHNLVGKRVMLRGIQENDHRSTKHIYPFFANHVQVIDDVQNDSCSNEIHSKTNEP